MRPSTPSLVRLDIPAHSHWERSQQSSRATEARRGDEHDDGVAWRETPSGRKSYTMHYSIVRPSFQGPLYARRDFLRLVLHFSFFFFQVRLWNEFVWITFFVSVRSLRTHSRPPAPSPLTTITRTHLLQHLLPEDGGTGYGRRR